MAERIGQGVLLGPLGVPKRVRVVAEGNVDRVRGNAHVEKGLPVRLGVSEDIAHAEDRHLGTADLQGGRRRSQPKPRPRKRKRHSSWQSHCKVGQRILSL